MGTSPDGAAARLSAAAIALLAWGLLLGGPSGPIAGSATPGSSMVITVVLATVLAVAGAVLAGYLLVRRPTWRPVPVPARRRSDLPSPVRAVDPDRPSCTRPRAPGAGRA